MRKKPLPYNKEMLVKNIRILMASKDVSWKEFDVSYNVIDNSRYDQDVRLALLVRIAKRLDVSLDTLVFTDLTGELETIDERNKNVTSNL